MTDTSLTGAFRDMPPPPVPSGSTAAVASSLKSVSSPMDRSASMGSAPRMTRMPSLKQLSERYASQAPPLSISTDVQSTASPSSSTRLRLPPSALTRSLSSQGSASSSLPPAQSSSPITDKLLDPLSPRTSAFPVTAGDRDPAGAGYIKGYKSVPTLDQIRKRVGSVSAVSGSNAIPSPVPEAMTSEVKAGTASESKTTSEVSAVIPPSSSASCETEKKHPLQHPWTMYFDSKSYRPPPPEGGSTGANSWESNLVTVGTFDTVEGFARYLNNVRTPSMLAKHSNYHVFKDGIKPMWEDPANANGGKWVLVVRNGSPMLDSAWADILLSLIGEQLDPDDEVCGVVVSTRPKVDRIQLWLRASSDVDKANAVAKRLLGVLGLEGREDEGFGLEFQYNASDARTAGKAFLSIPYNANSHSHSHAGPLELPPRPSPSAPMWRSASASGAFSGPLGGSRIPSKV